MDPSACPQYRKLCFRQSSARCGRAIAKATVMLLLATPSLPNLDSPSRAYFARYRPGPADSLPSFSFHSSRQLLRLFLLHLPFFPTAFSLFHHTPRKKVRYRGGKYISFLPLPFPSSLALLNPVNVSALCSPLFFEHLWEVGLRF